MINPNEAIALLDRTGIVLIKWSNGSQTSATFVSDNISQFGYVPSDFYEGEFKEYWKFVHEEDRDRARHDIDAARKRAEGEESYTVELSYRVRCKNGEIRWVEVILLYDRGEDGLRERGFLKDVTHSANMIQHMRESAEKYNFLSEHVDEFIFVIDRFDMLVTANSTFYESSACLEGSNISGLIRHNSKTLYEFLQDVSNGMDIELNLKDKIVYSSIFVTKLSSGNMYVVIRDMDEITKLREHFDFMRDRDLSSGLLNQNALENFIRASAGDIGYRVVMIKVLDYKNEVQKNGFGYADLIAEKVAEVIVSEFAMYDDNIFRSFEDEYVIFTRSPINNIHIYNSNKRLADLVQLEWGVSKRGVNLRELLTDARCNFKEYDRVLPVGTIFGFNQ
ncbi:MAG: PAS domain-containing protein [Bacillota bacterium]|nr:PAS domain-containing protein [Bacillota bacterium]